MTGLQDSMPRDDRRRRAVLYVLSFSMLIVSLDQYIVVVALPDIARDLGYTPHTLQAVVSAYVVASGGFLLFGGRAADLLGHRRILVTGLALYCCSSLAGGLAGSAIEQIGARAVQGLGGALVFPSTLALINVRFSEGEERNRALGMWAGAGAAGLVVGVLLGGALTAMFGWRAVFLVNVPLAGAAIIAALLLIERDGMVDRTRPFDIAGSMTVTGAISALVVALIEGPVIGWTAPLTIAMLVGGLCLGIAFVIIQRRGADPLVPLAMLRNRWLRLALAAAGLFMATFGALLYFLSIFLQDVLGYDALRTGSAFIIPTGVVVIASIAAGWTITRWGVRNTMIVALAVGGLGAVWLASVLKPQASLGDLLPGLVAVSIGDGAMFTAMFVAAGKDVPDDRQGIASGLVSTSQSVGAALGLAVLVLLANSGAAGAGSEEAQAAVAKGIARAVYAIAAGIGLTLVLAIRFREGGTLKAALGN